MKTQIKLLALTGFTTFALALPAQNTFPSTGNVGIGTTTPSALLTLQGGGLSIINSDGDMRFSIGGNGNVNIEGNLSIEESIGINGGASIEKNLGVNGSISAEKSISTNGSFSADGDITTPKNITATDYGRIGIGITSPKVPLHIVTEKLGFNIAVGLHNHELDLDENLTIGIGFLNNNAHTGWKAAIVHERLDTLSPVGALHFLVSSQYNSNPVTWDDTRMSIMPSGNVGIGTTNPSHMLSVNGAIRAKEIIVNTNWADDVFTKDYNLLSLSDIETHIIKEGRLPGVPSAEQVQNEGVSLGDTQSLLLRKIEELTLHMIQMEKRVTELEAENAALKREK